MKEENPEETIPCNPWTVDAGVLLARRGHAVDDVEKDVYEGHDYVAVAEDDFDNLGIGRPPILKAVRRTGFVRCGNITVGYRSPLS